MSESITLTMVYGGRIHYMRDLDKLDSTKEFREKIRKILKENLELGITCCRPHISLLIMLSLIILIVTLALILGKLVSNLGFIMFAAIPVICLICGVSICHYECKYSNLFYKTMADIDSSTNGIHRMEGKLQNNSYITTFTITSSNARLKKYKEEEERKELQEKNQLQQGERRSTRVQKPSELQWKNPIINNKIEIPMLDSLPNKFHNIQKSPLNPNIKEEYHAPYQGPKVIPKKQPYPGVQFFRGQQPPLEQHPLQKNSPVDDPFARQINPVNPINDQQAPYMYTVDVGNKNKMTTDGFYQVPTEEVQNLNEKKK